MGIENVSILNIDGKLKDFTFVLTTKDYRHLDILHNIDYDNINMSGRLSTSNELSFIVYKTKMKETKDGVIEFKEPLWDEIVDDKVLYIPELNAHYAIAVQLDDTVDNIKKTITCTSLCESELGQVKIYGLEVNTEIDIGRDDYSPTVFYDEDHSDYSLLNRALSFMPQYKIMHVDASLCNIQRTFSVDDVPIYDWLTGDCANEFHCLFLFNSSNRGVYVYDLYSVCEDCGHREENMDVCSKCGSTKIKYFGEDSGIYIDKENLTDAIQLTIDAGSIKNCFRLIAGDDLITATVRLLNPNGTDFIYMPTENQLREMPDKLREKIISYNELYASLEDDFEGLVADLFESMEKIDYYTYTMMPTKEHETVTAQTEADKLTAMNLSPLGLAKVTKHSKATVESALKNYAKVYVKTGYVKLDINSSEYTYVGEGSDGFIHGTWTGNFKVTSYSDNTDIAYSEVITINITNDYEAFLEQKIKKNIATNSDEEDSVFDVLNIDELEDFKVALELYSLSRLKSFYDAIQSALDVLIEVDQASEGADLYESLYLTYYDKLQACQTELDKRQATIDEWQNTYDNIALRQQELQNELNFRNYLGEELYSIFCLYRREETYQNDNYISDGLSNSEIIEKAKEFIATAKNELEKARTPKISITSTLYNLLLLPKFKPIIKHFKLGSWLRIRVDGQLYHLMLIGYDLSSSSLETMNVEFANVTKINTVSDVTADILSQSQSMATTYNYIANQASKGNEANDFVNEAVQNGLNSALSIIKNNNNEEVVIDKHGLWAKTKDDITGEYELEQLRITHNILAYSNDGFKTVKTALGKHKYSKFNDKNELIEDMAYGLCNEKISFEMIKGVFLC